MSNTKLPEVGQRVMCMSMPGDPHPIPTGTKGTVTGSYPFMASNYMTVKWDNGRSLSLLADVDKWVTV